MKKKKNPRQKGSPPAKVVKSKILLVDDHPIVRQGIMQLIEQEGDLAVCGQAENAHRAMESIEATKPDMAIVDISLNGTNGIELIKTIKANHIQLPVLVLSMHDESLYAERALRGGARGYVMKQEAPEKLLNAIRQVLSGKIYVSDKVGTKILSQFSNGRPPNGDSAVDQLSDRELEVFQLIGQGRGTRQIAKELHRSVKTIESHRAHIKEKMKLDTATELVRHAVQWTESKSAG